MSRSADYTIQGFLYQFNKTLLEILNSDSSDVIQVEGIIEDIEIIKPESISAIQCKYHETQETFNLSIVYKPILQMMEHYIQNNQANIEYILYAHFPNTNPGEQLNINKADIEEILKSTNKNYEKLINKIKGKIDIDEFLKNFKLEYGFSFQQISQKVCEALIESGLEKDEIETLYYPNAVQKMGEISILHDASERRIDKQRLIADLKLIRKTAVSKWTIALQSKDKLLRKRRNQLKSNLDKNSRLRYLILSDSINGFNDEIVNFISDYITKYHFKEIHDKTPVFCLDCSIEIFDELRVRLHKRGLKFNDGFVTDKYFDRTKFLSMPHREKTGKNYFREYDLKLINFRNSDVEILVEYKPEDFYIFSQDLPSWEFIDSNVEHLWLENFSQIKYILGIGDTYE